MRLKIVGWTLSIAGLILWLYGYLTIGHPTLVAWRTNVPWWIADYLPNLEAEIGVALMFVGMVPLYWPASRNTQ